MNAWSVLGTLLTLQVVHPPQGLVRTQAQLLTDTGQLITFVVPGANGMPPAAIVGVPVLAVGQHLALDLHRAPAGWVPVGLGAGMHMLSQPPGEVAPPWTLNGLHYEPEQLPLVYLLNQAGNAQVGLATTEAEVQYGLAAWSGVGCATWSFVYGGTTDQLPADDGLNVIAWENESWEWGAEVAGMNMTRFGTDGVNVFPAGSDILFNGVDYSWTTEPGDLYTANPTLNLGSVLVHELGHVTGMDHEYSLITSTMFYAYIGGDWMRSLSGDDRRGLCENYPSGADECVTDEDCIGIDDMPRHCEEMDGVRVCAEDRDPLGSACSRTAINCESLCIFTNPIATEGYCSQPCEDGDCPRGFTCGEASLLIPDDDVPVCLIGGDTGLPDSGLPDTGAGPGESGQKDPSDDGPCGCQPGGAAGAFTALLAFLAALRRRRPLWS